MTIEILGALTLFAFVSSITPGPNNMMLLASGVNFGFARSLPHMLGVAIGFTLMVFLVGIGVMKLFDLYPASYSVLKVISIIYLLYLAWKIANAADPVEEQGSSARPMTFLQAAGFQWVNPKAWTMALTAISVYAPTKSLWSVIVVAAVFGCVNLPSISAWVVMGQRLRKWLTDHKRLRLFNFTMAGFLVCSLIPTLV